MHVMPIVSVKIAMVFNIYSFHHTVCHVFMGSSFYKPLWNFIGGQERDWNPTSPFRNNLMGKIALKTKASLFE